MPVEELPAIPPNSNPFIHNAYHMGTILGKNVTVMFEKHESDYQDYIIVINTATGERMKIHLRP